MYVIFCFRVVSLLLVLVDLILVIADLATPNKSTEVHINTENEFLANNFHLVGSQGENTSKQPK